MKHQFAAIVVLLHLVAFWAMWKLADTDTDQNGNFIGVGLIGALLVIGDLAIVAVAAFSLVLRLTEFIGWL